MSIFLWYLQRFMADNIKYHFFRRLKNKYRLVILNDGTFEERVSFKITPFLIVLIVFVFSLSLVFLSFLLFSLTPLNEYIPGKTSTETQKSLIEMAVNVDSLRLHTEERHLYIEHLKTILSGGVVQTELQREENKIVEKDNSLDISKEDSIFRLRVEEKSNGDYVSLASEPEIYFFNPSSTASVKHFISRANSMSEYPGSTDNYVAGYANTTSAVTGVRFHAVSGNTISGTFLLYGIKDS